MEKIYESIGTFIQLRTPFVMVTILEKSGSAPREAGTKMLVKEDETIIGTIGGGILEALSIRHAMTCFQSKRCEIRAFSLSNREASSIGMICGGDIKALFEYFGPEFPERLALLERAAAHTEDFVMVTDITERVSGIADGTKTLIVPQLARGEKVEGSKALVQEIQNDFDRTAFRVRTFEGRTYLIDPHHNREHLCIFGAGHVAVEIADIAKNLNFYTTVVDDREEFANRTRFPEAGAVRVIEDYSDLLSNIHIHSNTYVVIVTRGHAFDKEVLEQVLQTNARYIGMIGSKTKRDQTYEKLLNEGYVQSDLDRVCCPIGLNIYAQTPAEIAISILAEMILLKRRPNYVDN